MMIDSKKLSNLLSRSGLLKFFMILLFLSSFLPFSELSAGNPREHDSFFTRLLTGVGGYYGSFRYPIEPYFTTTSIASLPFSVSLQIGKAVVKNFIIYLNGSAGLTTAGSSKIQREDGTQISTVTELNTYIYSIGIGTSYYLPKNFYLSFEFRAGVFTFSQLIVPSPEEVISEILTQGNGFEISVGKDFWISKSFLWGIALFFTFDRMSYVEYKTNPVEPFSDFTPDIPFTLLRESKAHQLRFGLFLTITYSS